MQRAQTTNRNFETERRKHNFDEGKHVLTRLSENTAKMYLIVTIICEYKILRFWDCDDFAGILIFAIS